MGKTERVTKLLKMCEDLQEQVHLRREICEDVDSLSFSCDLLLRNMIMILEKEKQGTPFTEELSYITNNLLGAHSHLTDQEAINTAHKYQVKY